MKWTAILLLLALSCGARKVAAPPAPTAGDPAPGWVDLRPGMELRVENAYYRPGSAERVIANYLGTEAITFLVRDDGALQARPVQSNVAERPPDQPPVKSLLPGSHLRRRNHRLFFQVLFRGQSESRSAVLLSARSPEEMDRQTSLLLSDASSACRQSGGCAVFPPTCTASLVRTIEVDGVRRVVPWAPERRP